MITFIGIGAMFRGDDAAGLAVCRNISACNLPGVRCVEQSGDGALLLDIWRGAETVIVCDAVMSAGPAGAWYEFDALTDTLPEQFFSYSTHQFGLAEAVKLAKNLDLLPKRLLITGIVGKSFALGAPLSAEVAVAVETAAARIKEMIMALSVESAAVAAEYMK